MKLKHIMAVILVVCLCTASTLTTRMSSYRTLYTIDDINSPDTDLAAATGFFIGAISGEVDLLMSGTETYANTVSIILHATTAANGDTITQKIYGRVDSGPPQLITSIVWTIGLAQVNATATNLWADTAVAAANHITDITVADGGGSDRIVSVTFDATGYRYLKSYFTADTGNPELVTALYRYY